MSVRGEEAPIAHRRGEIQASMDLPLELPLKFLALLLAAVVAGCHARRPDEARESFGGRGAGIYHELQRAADS